jgi:hypothetical protein
MSTQTTINSDELFIGGEWVEPHGFDRTSSYAPFTSIHQLSHVVDRKAGAGHSGSAAASGRAIPSAASRSPSACRRVASALTTTRSTPPLRSGA